MSAPTFSIDEFRTALQTPARGHLFQCVITPPDIFTDDSLFPVDHVYLCKSVTLPSSTIEPVELAYYGRSVRLPGKRTYQPVTLTFFNHENYQLRGCFELWSNILNELQYNVRSDEVISYYGTIDLTHFSTQGEKIAMYTLYNAFPTSVSGLSFSYDGDGEIQTFDVEFTFNWYSFAQL